MLEEKSSFRDPSGKVYFYSDGTIYRYIYPPYFDAYDRLIESGLYGDLISRGLLIPHDMVKSLPSAIIIQPVRVPFISYPYEWCFSMLKEAALNTLNINRLALKKDMLLKDASAFNMQYFEGRMTLIDTTSFMEYESGMPWGSYRQFIQHFVCPLLLMAKVSPGLNRLTSLFIDGIPLKLAAKLLPNRLHFSPSVLMHIYAQSLDVDVKGKREVSMSRTALEALLDNLEGLVNGINYNGRSLWTNYGDAGSYTARGIESKMLAVTGILNGIDKGAVCDLGANTGTYSAISGSVLSVDSDHDCIDRIYRDYESRGLPLVIDLCNPSPSIGWDNTERRSFLDRLHVDTIMALALIHHLCIGNNTPLERAAEMLSNHCRNLIIEWVPPEDKQAQKLLGKKNIPLYNHGVFHAAFGKYFKIVEAHPVAESQRVIYYMVVT